MGVAAKPRYAIVFVMILTLGVSLSLPAEDVLDAVYDESEPLPYEVIPPVSIVVAPVTAGPTQGVADSVWQEPGIPSRFSSARVRDTDAHRSTDKRALSVLLCVLLCQLRK
jgi:hypothetical protein